MSVRNQPVRSTGRGGAVAEFDPVGELPNSSRTEVANPPLLDARNSEISTSATTRSGSTRVAPRQPDERVGAGREVADAVVGAQRRSRCRAAARGTRSDTGPADRDHPVAGWPLTRRSAGSTPATASSKPTSMEVSIPAPCRPPEGRADRGSGRSSRREGEGGVDDEVVVASGTVECLDGQDVRAGHQVRAGVGQRVGHPGDRLGGRQRRATEGHEPAGMLYRSTSCPLIHARQPSSLSVANSSVSISATSATVNVARRNRQE